MCAATARMGGDMEHEMQAAFAVWRGQLVQETLRERLPVHWEVQHDGSHDTRPPPLQALVAGEGVVPGVSYVNTRSGARSIAHPNMRKAASTAKAQGAAAQERLRAALNTVTRFTNALQAGQWQAAIAAADAVGGVWALVQGNAARQQHTARRQAPPEAPPQAAAVQFSPLVSPQVPPAGAAPPDLSEEALYDTSQLVPSDRSVRRQPVQPRTTNKSALADMLSSTKGRLASLLAKAMQ